MDVSLHQTSLPAVLLAQKNYFEVHFTRHLPAQTQNFSTVAYNLAASATQFVMNIKNFVILAGVVARCTDGPHLIEGRGYQPPGEVVLDQRACGTILCL